MLMLVSGLFGSLPSARADAPIVVLVTDTAGTAVAVDKLRADLGAKLGIRLVLAREASVEARHPVALLSISVDKSSVVSVLYWDRNGEPDFLSAPAPAAADRLDTVIATLSAALLRKHIDALSQATADRAPFDDEGAPVLLDAKDVLAALSTLGIVRHRTAVLRIEDF